MKTNPTCAASSAAGTRWRTTATSLRGLFPVTRNASTESVSQRTDRPHLCCACGRSETTFDPLRTFDRRCGRVGRSNQNCPLKDACHERNHYRRQQSQHREPYEWLVRHVAVRD